MTGDFSFFIRLSLASVHGNSTAVVVDDVDVVVDDVDAVIVEDVAVVLLFLVAIVDNDYRLNRPLKQVLDKK